MILCIVIQMFQLYTYLDLPVTVFAMVRKILGGLINSFNILDSVVRGNPLSNISSNNSYTTT